MIEKEELFQITQAMTNASSEHIKPRYRWPEYHNNNSTRAILVKWEQIIEATISTRLPIYFLISSFLWPLFNSSLDRKEGREKDVQQNGPRTWLWSGIIVLTTVASAPTLSYEAPSNLPKIILKNNAWSGEFQQVQYSDASELH